MNRRLRRILERVFNDVPEGFAKSRYDRPRSHRHLRRCSRRPAGRRGAARHRLDRAGVLRVDLSETAAFRHHAREAHQPIDQAAHVLLFDRHRRENLSRDLRLLDRTSTQHVDVAADDGQRCAQLVPSVGCELAHAFLGARVLPSRSRRRGGIVVGCGQRATSSPLSMKAALRVVTARERAQRIGHFVDRRKLCPANSRPMNHEIRMAMTAIVITITHQYGPSRRAAAAGEAANATKPPFTLRGARRQVDAWPDRCAQTLTRNVHCW